MLLKVLLFHGWAKNSLAESLTLRKRVSAPPWGWSSRSLSGRRPFPGCRFPVTQDFRATIATMPEISTVKPHIQSRARLGRALFVAGKTLIISILKTLYALWLEVTGLIFA